MPIKHFILLLFLAFSLHASETCFFIPPKGWEIANPEIVAPRVHICFLGKSPSGLLPSVNLATEKVNISLEAYVEEVRKIHAADPNTRWRDLGKFKTPLGEGRLTEIESPTELGRARLVQLIVIKGRTAYILTASAFKEEFSKYYKTFDQVLRSLQISSNLIESYSPKSQQLTLKNLIHILEADSLAFAKEQPLSEELFNSEAFQKSLWKPFEQKIINTFTEMGPYWQILLLHETHDSLLTARSK